MLVYFKKLTQAIFLALMTTMAMGDSGADVITTQILNISDSGKTLLLDVGINQQLKAGDWMILLQQTNDPRGPKLVPVVRGRVLRSSPKRAMVMSYKIYENHRPAKAGRYWLMSEGRSLNGRRNLENDRQKITDTSKSMPETVANKQSGDKDTLALRIDEYRVLRKNHELGESYAKDGALIDGDEWVTAGSGNDRYARSMWRSPHAAEFARDKRMETFDKMVANYLWKVNEPDYTYEKFYADHHRAMGLSSVTTQTVYQKHLDQVAISKAKEARLHQEILVKGESWSSDYSDEELARVLESVGEIDEINRREQAVVVVHTWQLAGNLGVNILDNENRADASNSRKAKWNLEALAEWYPSPHHDVMRRLGITFGGRYVEDGVSVGDLNARVTETSFSVGGNWHFWQFPFAVEKNIPFVGAGIRTGIASLAIPSRGERGSYTVLGVPMVVGGVKYNFRSGWGLRLAASMEKLLMEQTSVNVRGGNLPQRTDLLDGRLSMGLTRFF